MKPMSIRSVNSGGYVILNSLDGVHKVCSKNSIEYLEMVLHFWHCKTIFWKFAWIQKTCWLNIDDQEKYLVQKITLSSPLQNENSFALNFVLHNSFIDNFIKDIRQLNSVRRMKSVLSYLIYWFAYRDSI